MTRQELLERFPHHRRSGDQVMVTCPAHEDGTASLSIGEGANGAILLNCKAGCTLDAILDRLHLSTRDLFPTSRPTKKPEIVATYDYTDARGTLLYQVVRFEPKTFRQRRPNGQKGWIWNLTGVERVLYRLPTLHDQVRVVIVEGEKDVDRLAAFGIVATTNAGGAEKWKHEYTCQLKNAGVRHVVILPDNDRPGQAHAQHVATSCHTAGLQVQILTLPDVPDKGDVSDYLADHTIAALETLIRDAPLYGSSEAPTGATVEVEPLAALLNRIVAFIQRYMILRVDQACAIALWVAHTYVFEAFDCTPYLSVRSAVKRSGKTRLFEILEVLVWRPWLTGRVSAAVLVRKTDAECPTLLLDESDTSLKVESEYSEALRGLLNTGYRSSGRASLCVGQGANITYRDFKTFSPKAIAGIGKLTETVADRSILIELKRRTSREAVERWRAREGKAAAARVRTALEAWRSPAKGPLHAARPALPPLLGDRQADVWEPLFAIADLAGDDWPDRARQAAVSLAQKAGAIDEDNYGEQLLADIREIFRTAKNPSAMHSQTIREQLCNLEDRPWKTFGRSEKEISGVAMANLLKSFGVLPAGSTIRIGDRTGKGYRRAAFLDAWKRYLTRFKTSHRHKPNKTEPQTAKTETSHFDDCDGSKTPKTSMNTASCDGVTFEKPDIARERESEKDTEPWLDI